MTVVVVQLAPAARDVKPARDVHEAGAGYDRVAVDGGSGGSGCRSRRAKRDERIAATRRQTGVGTLQHVRIRPIRVGDTGGEAVGAEVLGVPEAGRECIVHSPRSQELEAGRLGLPQEKWRGVFYT